MHKPALTTFEQFNSRHITIGKIYTVISLFIKYVSSEFGVRVVGKQSNPTKPMGK